MIINGFIVIGLILFTYGATSLCVTKNTNIHNYILLSKSVKGMKKYKKELLNNFMIEFSNSNYTDMNEYNADTNKWTEYCEKEEEVQNSIEYLKNQLNIIRDNIIYDIVFKKNKCSEIEDKKTEDKSKSWKELLLDNPIFGKITINEKEKSNEFNKEKVENILKNVDTTNRNILIKAKNCNSNGRCNKDLIPCFSEDGNWNCENYKCKYYERDENNEKENLIHDYYDELNDCYVRTLKKLISESKYNISHARIRIGKEQEAMSYVENIYNPKSVFKIDFSKIKSDDKIFEQLFSEEHPEFFEYPTFNGERIKYNKNGIPIMPTKQSIG